MLGTEFIRVYHDNGLPAWEAAALAIARQDGLTPWPWFELPLADDKGNQAVLQVQSDVVSIGPIEDHVRLPLTPGTAQSILNLSGALLPTPWLVYQIWRASPLKLAPIRMPVTASLNGFAQHSAMIDQQILAADQADRRTGGQADKLPVAGIKKHVVVSNIAQPGKVLIFGWYNPAPDVFDDGRPWNDPNRQPIQVKSNVHGAFYVDYSHGIQAIGPTAIVNGQPMNTVDLYQHPLLSSLVSNEGPIRVPRYPSPVVPAKNRPAHVAVYPASMVRVATTPSLSDVGLAELAKR